MALGYKIMIVEDDRTITEVLGRQLERWGYAVCIPEDFSRVDREFLKEEPDLVLMDISLPYYDGYHWCEEIRRVSQAPIIFISSAGEDMNQVMALHMGADDFIASLKKDPDYKDAFVQEETPGGAGDGTQQQTGPAGIPGGAPGTIPGTPLPGAQTQTQQRPLPQFATGVNGAGAAGAGSQNPFASFHFTDVRPRPAAGGTNQ